MTDVDLEFSRVRAVLDRPTLRLMSRPTSAAVIAVFRTVFDRDVQYVPADRMHLQVEEHVARLQATGARVPASDQAEGTSTRVRTAVPSAGTGSRRSGSSARTPPTATSSTR